MQHTLSVQIARFMGPTWAHLGPVVPWWAPCWPREPCYLGVLLLKRTVETKWSAYWLKIKRQQTQWNIAKPVRGWLSSNSIGVTWTVALINMRLFVHFQLNRIIMTKNNYWRDRWGLYWWYRMFDLAQRIFTSALTYKLMSINVAARHTNRKLHYLLCIM